MADRSVPADLAESASPRHHTPLYGPDSAAVVSHPLDTELWLARDFLSEVASANIHDPAAMIQAAAGLYYRLAAVVEAASAERSVS